MRKRYEINVPNGVLDNMAKYKNPLLDDPKNNEYMFLEMLKKFKPELFVLNDLLETTQVSCYILFKIIKHLKNISEGTQHGKVEIDVTGGVVTYIRGVEQDKLLEPIIKQSKESL